MNERNEVVDLTVGEIDADHGVVAPVAPASASASPPRNSALQLTRIRIDMCPFPKPSVRWGSGRGGPVRRYFDASTTQKLNQLRQAAAAAANNQNVTMISRNQPVRIKAWFFLKRPAEDFVSRIRDASRIRGGPNTQNTVVPVTPDVDNCGKFLLDALKGTLYEDDAQVVMLELYKLRDCEGACNGRMQIECSLLDETSVASMIPSW